MGKPTLNVDAFLAVADVIERFDRFDIASVATVAGRRQGTVPTTTVWHNCGTTACVAGWTLAWADINDELVDDWETAAGAELGISYKQGSRLFFWYSDSVWSSLAGEYGWTLDRYGHVSDLQAIRADQAADVLRRIARGEVEL